MIHRSAASYWFRIIAFTVVLLLVGTLFIISFLSFQSAHGYTHPQRILRQSDDNPLQFGVSFQAIKLETIDGINLAAWYTPTQNGALILVAHGYNAARSAQMHSLFAQHGYGVISWDARAHGQSQGEICTFGYLESRDVQAALNFASMQDEVKHIGAFGESMGAVTLIQAATDQPRIEALIADSAFASIEDMLERVIPHPIFRPFIKFFIERETQLSMQDLRPIDAIQNISPRAVFIIQGDADLTVAPESAKLLFDAAGEPRQLWVEAGIGHVGTYTALPDKYEYLAIAFFDQYLLGQ